MLARQSRCPAAQRNGPHRPGVQRRPIGLHNYGELVAARRGHGFIRRASGALASASVQKTSCEIADDSLLPAIDPHRPQFTRQTEDNVFGLAVQFQNFGARRRRPFFQTIDDSHNQHLGC